MLRLEVRPQPSKGWGYASPLLALAIIGGDPRRFVPYVELYHRAVAQLDKVARPVGVHSPGFIAKTDAEAITSRITLTKLREQSLAKQKH